MEKTEALSNNEELLVLLRDYFIEQNNIIEKALKEQEQKTWRYKWKNFWQKLKH